MDIFVFRQPADNCFALGSLAVKTESPHFAVMAVSLKRWGIAYDNQKPYGKEKQRFTLFNGQGSANQQAAKAVIAAPEPVYINTGIACHFVIFRFHFTYKVRKKQDCSLSVRDNLQIFIRW